MGQNITPQRLTTGPKMAQSYDYDARKEWNARFDRSQWQGCGLNLPARPSGDKLLSWEKGGATRANNDAHVVKSMR